ncbi:hypothetical protein ACTXT7_004593 [Hymenolepis weldensis]
MNPEMTKLRKLGFEQRDKVNYTLQEKADKSMFQNSYKYILFFEQFILESFALLSVQMRSPD